VFEDRVLRKTSGPKRWGFNNILLGEKLRRIRWAGHVTRINRTAYRVSVTAPEGKNI
jgi:hypothetical protein